MNDRAASFDWMTSMKATTPNTIQEKLPRFIVPTRAIAIQTHTTPDRVDAIAFCRPWVLPPAAKKQAHATTPPGTARLAIAPTFTHRATSTPTLTASANSLSIRYCLASRVPVTPDLAAVRVLEGRLRTVLDAELREQMLYVELHRVVREPEPLGDLRVGEPAGDERPDLAFPGGQVAGRPGRSSLDPAARGLGEDELTRVYLADRRQRLLGRFRLEGQAVRAGVEGRAERFAVVVRGQHEHLGGRGVVAQGGEHCGALDRRELEIEHDDVGLVLLHQLHDLGAVGGPAGDRAVAPPVEQGAQALEYESVVVRQQDADHRRALIPPAA